MASRRPLPRLVEQTRILLWFQFYLTIINILVAVIVVVVWDSAQSAVQDRDLEIDPFLIHMDFMLLGLVSTAVVLGVTAALTRRGFLVAFPLAFLAEAGVVVDVVFAFRIGIVLILVTTLLLALGGWITANLFRSEVRRFLLHPGVAALRS